MNFHFQFSFLNSQFQFSFLNFGFQFSSLKRVLRPLERVLTVDIG